MPISDNLSRPARSFIVLVSLLQGLLLYLADTGMEHAWWPFTQLGGRVCWYTLVLAAPTMMLLSVVRLDDRRFWQHALGVTLVYAIFAWWAAWSATGAPHLESSAVLAPFGWQMTIALFVALPYLQCRLEHARWRAPYADLFEYAWQNLLTLLLALLFVGICWGVLELWAQLFVLVKIQFFSDLFRERPFVYLATGAMAGLGILIGRTQQRPVKVARQILFAIFTGLLPLLAFIALLFVASLPFTGLEPLWNTRAADQILMGVLALLILFVNAVYQDGGGVRPYPAWLRRLVEAGLLVMPIYAALGLYALHLRVAQHGWTAERIWAALLSTQLTGYALGYAWAVLRGRGEWLRGFTRVNLALSFVALALIVSVNSLLLDPHRITVDSQLARLHDGRTAAKDLDLNYLRFRAGRRGYFALQALRDDETIRADATVLADVENTLKRTSRWSWRGAENHSSTAVYTVAAARALIRVAPDAESPDDAWLQALLVSGSHKGNCLLSDADCVLLTPDLDGDGRTERILCDVAVPWGAACEVWTSNGSGTWSRAANFSLYESRGAGLIRGSLRDGKLTIKRQRWPDIEVAGSHARIE